METEKKKILILYAAIGLGHKSIAENIGYYLEVAGYEVKLMDAQKTQGGILASFGKKFYQWMINKIPGLWEWFYNTEWFIKLTLPYRTKVAAKNYKHILNEVILFQPDIIISTHTTASAIVSYIKTEQLFKGQFIIAFSDFHLHPYWLYQNADYYLANTQEQKEEMEELGVYRNKIFVCGICLKPKVLVDVKKVKNKFGIKDDEKVVLVSSGSQGFGVDESLIDKIAKREKTKIIVICGNSQTTFDYLTQKYINTNVIVLGYYNFMEELYAISDIFISKAGALSIAEALSWRLSILVTHLLPGQEAHNYTYLLENGLVMPEPINIIDSILEELDAANFKKSIKLNAKIDIILGDGQKIGLAVKEVLEVTPGAKEVDKLSS
jgi:processive 1,2-diacylglycerol beta-glucosyltransferase